MTSKVVLLALLSCIAVHGVAAKSTATSLEQKIDELLEELREEDKRADTETEIKMDEKALKTEENVQSSSDTKTKVDDVRELDTDLENLEKDIRNLIATADNGIKREEKTAKKKSAKRKRVFEGLDTDEIGLELLNQEMQNAFTFADEIVTKDEEQKKYYYQRGGNLVWFDTNTNNALLSEHAYVLDNRKYIIFEVRACQDAYVDLIADTDGDLYKIHIGNNDNTELLINKIQGTNTETGATVSSNALDCSRYSRFMISWDQGRIQVLYEDENGDGWLSLADWTDSGTPLNIVDIGFTTGDGVDGFWKTVYRGSPTSITTSATGNDSSHVFELLQNEPFNYPLVQEPFVIFQVQACSNVRIGLKEDDTDDGKLWEIAFDAERNGKKEIQIWRAIGRSRKASEIITVLDCDSLQRFLVSWRNNHIQVFHDSANGWASIIDWVDDKGRDVAYMGVYGNADEWIFYDDHEIGIDIPAGGSTSETMAGLNDLEVNLSELEIKEYRANIVIYALNYFLDNGPFKTVKELKEIPGFSDAFEQAQTDHDSKACNGENIRCPNRIKNSPFRTIDGTCNNLNNPGWGSTGTPQSRLIDAAYEDGVSQPNNVGVNGNKLPSPRQVSHIAMRNDSDVDGETPDDPTRTVMMAIFGQFMDHDITETPQVKGLHETTVGCCAIPDELIRNERIQCNTIAIDPATDPDYDHTCMGFRRSLPTGHGCEPSVREQLNDITSYIDGSQIYGSTEEVARSLRALVNGKLLVAEESDLLPKNKDSACVLDDPNKGHCFLAGDIRVNENPQLMTLHTAFVRYHNHLCDKLLNENLSIDEDIYQISRKIIGAILQNIFYGQWLPSAVGQDLMDANGLTVGSPYSYDDTVDPSVINAFAGAAFRYGHTLVDGKIVTLDDNFRKLDEVQLKDSFFNTSLAFKSIDEIARTMPLYKCKESDAFLVDALKTFLFQTATSHGMDLTALNIQRGRDHGLDSYVAFRKWNGMSVPSDFSELSSHTPEAQAKLASVYADVRDIDLFPGAMLETNVPGGHIGETFAAILIEQFKRLKVGDRFYFETTGDEGFLPEQLANIKSVTFAKIMCVAFGLDVIQENVFLLPNVEDLKACESFTDIDASLFANIP